jgi:hypothetical protein
VNRADVVAMQVGDLRGFFREVDKIQSEIECILRALIRKRSGGEFQYSFYARRRDPAPAPDPEEEEELLDDDPIDRLMALSPEQRRALAEKQKDKG